MKSPFLNKKLSDEEAIELAILEAKKGWPFVSPNPPVGSVILNQQRQLLSSGFYTCYGALHAEVVALNKIKDKTALKGAKLFVTLEPCAHTGQNPPCVKTLLKYPFSKIMYGIEDPNPKTKGRGLKLLKSKGFKIQKSPYQQNSLCRLYEAFTENMNNKSSFFALKVASSLDGVMALSHGESQWITEPESRDQVFRLRALFDAVLIGVNTFLQDRPRLNSRLKEFKSLTNKVCILDPSGRCLNLIKSSALAKVRPLKNIFVITQENHKAILKPKGFKIITLPRLSPLKPLCLKTLGQKLYKQGIGSVLVEGGASTLAPFLQQNIAQRLYLFINPCLLGGVTGLYWTEKLNSPSLNKRKTLKNLEILSFNKDLLLTGQL